MVIGDFHSYLETDQGVQFRKNFINITIDIFHDSSVCSEFFDEYFFFIYREKSQIFIVLI